MKRRNSGRNQRFVEMAVCREIVKTDSAADPAVIEDTDKLSEIQKIRKTSFFSRSKIIRVLPSITVVMVVATLVLHMTIGGGAALVPVGDDISCHDDGFVDGGLASAESLAVGDFAYNRSLQENYDPTEETAGVTTATVTEIIESTTTNESQEPEAADLTETTAAETEPQVEEPVFETADETMFLRTDRVNLRSGPSTDTEIAAVLEIGQVMQRIGISTEWSRIKLENGVEGYLMNKFIDSSAPPAPVPEPTAAPTAAPTVAPAAPVTVEKASSMSAETQQQMVAFARSFIGYPYVYATSGPSSFDCSGFTSYIYREMFGISLPRSARDQAFVGTGVSAANIQIGDIICFDWKTDGVCDHVGLYIGNGQYVDASYSRGLVREGTVNFSSNPILSIRRIVN